MSRNAPSPSKTSKKGAPKKSAPPPSPGPGERALEWWLNAQSMLWNALGLAALVLALLTLLALLNLSHGRWLDLWVVVLRRLFGLGGAFLMVLALGGLGIGGLYGATGRPLRLPWGRVIALEVAALATCGLLSLLQGHRPLQVEQGLGGGMVGWGLVEVLDLTLSRAGTWLVLSLAWLGGLVYGTGLGGWVARWRRRKGRSPSPPLPEPAAVSVDPAPEAEAPAAPRRSRRKARPAAKPSLPLHIADPREERAPAVARDERLPPLDLLQPERSYRPDERTISQNAGLIEKTLAEFGIPAKVVHVQVGPTVTLYAVEPGYVEKEGAEGEVQRQKVRVAQISALRRDLALALSAQRLRIQAPVPGRPYVGIEVPNAKAAVVRLRPLLESEAFYRMGSPLALALGRDVSGRPVVADLGKMPHLLIAGTTGSGKSVCISAITTCLVMNNTPEDLRLVMIDPKMVELVRFNGLPHLIGKVETDLERILGVLRWAVAEMDRRYKLLEEARARDIRAYNLKMRRKKQPPLPFIVLLIDELADLMMTAPDETERALVRLAQMARATGIHLVVATQRPSTDVVTGLIKANFPARMAFAVASGVDSRVILDTPGAEHLLGRGDMLFLPPDAPAPIRAQGAWVSDREVERVISFWRQAHPEEEDEAPPWETLLQQQGALEGHDPLIAEAARLVIRTQRASTTMLQRRLRVGYPRAARIMEELERLGVVSPPGERREREVLLASEEEFSLGGGPPPEEDAASGAP